jgi:hypothetical protein
MRKVYLVFIDETLEEKPIDETITELEKKGVDVTFCQVAMPIGKVVELLEFETGEG